MSYAINRERVIDAFRHGLLEKLDEIAIEQFGTTLTPLPQQPGARDGDLPELFRCIDAHAERLARRYGATLVEYATS